ncbi:MAG: enoyl-CoA hydratase/isomerase family protein [Moorea sp. SIO3C2]|nr:enoyl-CoA hydratase/isomerase family protein [Moorena sp. SIO3C2]
MTDFEGFRVTVDGCLGEIVLDRPEHLNPMTTETLLDLERAARWFDAQDDVRVVVVRGAGRAFSAGADLRSFTPGGMGGRSPEEAADAGRRMADAVEAMRATTIAAIHGHCVGGGLVLAAACDLRWAAVDTRFSIPEVDLGIPLAWGGIHRLVREIGPAATRELVMTCRPFSADEALRLRFLNGVVDADELDRVVAETAETIAAKPAYAIRATKRAVDAVTRPMVNLDASVADAMALVVGLHDEEGRAAAARYLDTRS